MSKRELLRYLLEINTSFMWQEILLCLSFSLVMSLIIFFTYKYTYSGTVYSRNFNTTLVIVSMVTTVVMIVIGSNLALSLGMVGALSIIRFRTVVKEPRDIGFLFWVITIGMASGARLYSVAFFGTIAIALVIIVFSFRGYDSTTYLLVVRGNDIGSAEDYLSSHRKLIKRWKMRVSSVSAGGVMEATYEIMFRSPISPEFIKTILDLPGIDSANLVSYSGEMVG